MTHENINEGNAIEKVAQLIRNCGVEVVVLNLGSNLTVLEVSETRWKRRIVVTETFKDNGFDAKLSVLNEVQSWLNASELNTGPGEVEFTLTLRELIEGSYIGVRERLEPPVCGAWAS